MTGIYMRKKIANSESPSIRAASMISGGKFLEFCLNIMIINGVEIAGSAKPQTVLRSLSLLIIVNSGIIVATPGIIIAIRRIANKTSLALS